ncbi:Mth938-like domain-containing protein [Niveibacterium sp.]|uniref:Mth938-like domain-containing protein n=1 Tax=Niveibacterium sp. TaxID=2017444 RepID=UPI0035AE59AA
MKLNLDLSAGTNVVTAHGAGFIAINGQRHSTSLIVGPQLLDTAWGKDRFESLTLDDFAALAAHEAVITLIGTGLRQRFPSPQLLRPLIEAQRGFEIMDTAAACRTYNILAAEGRKVIAAMVVESAA